MFRACGWGYSCGYLSLGCRGQVGLDAGVAVDLVVDQNEAVGELGDAGENLSPVLGEDLPPLRGAAGNAADRPAPLPRNCSNAGPKSELDSSGTAATRCLNRLTCPWLRARPNVSRSPTPA